MAEVESEVKPDCLADDAGRESVALIIINPEIVVSQGDLIWQHLVSTTGSGNRCRPHTRLERVDIAVCRCGYFSALAARALKIALSLVGITLQGMPYTKVVQGHCLSVLLRHVHPGHSN